MQDVHKIFPRKYFVKTSCIGMVVLAYIGAQTLPVPQVEKAYKESVFEIASAEVVTPVEIITTTSTTVVEETTTVPEPATTTSTTVVKVVTTLAKTTTTLPAVNLSGADGPPHNTTTLVGCISYYESTWGVDPNVFQFTQGTWEAYGGVGSPSRAPYSKQEAIFWIAWEDDGPHHWAAQKGRCF